MAAAKTPVPPIVVSACDDWSPRVRERDEVDVVAERPQPVGHLGGLGEGEGAAAGTEAQGGHDAPPSSWCTAVGGVDTAATVWGSRSNSSRSAAA